MAVPSPVLNLSLSSRDGSVIKSDYLCLALSAPRGSIQSPIIPISWESNTLFWHLEIPALVCTCTHTQTHIDNLKYEINLGLLFLLSGELVIHVGCSCSAQWLFLAASFSPLSSIALILAQELSAWVTFEPQYLWVSGIFFPPSCSPPPWVFSLTMDKLIYGWSESVLWDTWIYSSLRSVEFNENICCPETSTMKVFVWEDVIRGTTLGLGYFIGSTVWEYILWWQGKYAGRKLLPLRSLVFSYPRGKIVEWPEREACFKLTSDPFPSGRGSTY